MSNLAAAALLLATMWCLEQYGDIALAGVLGFIGGGLKKLGGLAKKAAPFVGMIPGVGTLAAAGLGGLGGLASGGLKGALQGAAGGALGGLGGGLLGKLGGVKGLIGGADLGRIAELGLAGLGTLQAGKQQGRSDELAQLALQQSAADRAAREPLRQQFMEGLGGLQGMERPDLGNVFGGTQNPFASPLVREAIGEPAAMPEPTIVPEPTVAPRRRVRQRVGNRGAGSRRGRKAQLF